ncbi:MAG: polyphosphate kinase 2 [Pseudomonadota bacterium]
MSKPFDGAISAFFEHPDQSDLRQAITSARKGDILNSSYPHRSEMKRKAYDKDIAALQIELVKWQAWVKESGARVAIVFEGRDGAGKGGTIKRFRENLNPRNARVVALSKPNDREMGEWYFQRYIQHLPTKGEIVFFDRSWYNRAVVEPVFGFCTPEQKEQFFGQVNKFEEMVAADGIHLIKFWLNVGRAEQLRRFLKRESDPLKQWKLSPIDVKGLSLWSEYTGAIEDMFARSHSTAAPWNVLRTDDKKRARLNAIRAVLSAMPYPLKDEKVVAQMDDKVIGGPDLWHA